MSNANMSKVNINEHPVVETPELSIEHTSQSPYADSRKRDNSRQRIPKPTSRSVQSGKKSKPSNNTVETLTDDLFCVLDITDSDSDDLSLDINKNNYWQRSSSSLSTESNGSAASTYSESDKEVSTDDGQEKPFHPIWVREPKDPKARCSGWGYVKVMGRLANAPKKSEKYKIRHIRRVYDKYFNDKHAYDITVVLGHVLYTMILSRSYYGWRYRMLHGSEGSSAEKIADLQRSNKTVYFNRHAVLTGKVRSYLGAVVSTFDDVDFKLAFRIFINCLLTIVRSLQSRLHYTRVKLVQLLCSCLIERKDDSRACSLLNSNRFVPDCSDVAEAVNKARKRDQHTEESMLLLSESFPWFRICVQHFQPVTSIVVRGADLDLESAIVKAAYNICLNSTFVENVH